MSRTLFFAMNEIERKVNDESALAAFHRLVARLEADAAAGGLPFVLHAMEVRGPLFSMVVFRCRRGVETYYNERIERVTAHLVRHYGIFAAD